MRKAGVDREKQKRKKERALEAVRQSSEDGKGSIGSKEDYMDVDQEGPAQRMRGVKRGPSNFGFGQRRQQLG